MVQCEVSKPDRQGSAETLMIAKSLLVEQLLAIVTWDFLVVGGGMALSQVVG